MSRPSSRWSTPLLVGSLARAGWGPLAGAETRGAAVVLRALVDLLDHRTGSGLTTAAQVADASGYTERWARDRMALLEAAGLITWQRGGVAAGRPQPSYVRIVKTAIAGLIAGARETITAVLAARRARTEARLAGLRRRDVRPRSRIRRSAHTELAASPTPYRGGDTPHTHPKAGAPAMINYSDETCEHGGEKRRMKSGLWACPFCRRDETFGAKAEAKAPAAVQPVLDEALDVQALRAGEHVTHRSGTHA